MRGGKADHYEWWHRPTKFVGPKRRERVSHLAWSAALIRPRLLFSRSSSNLVCKHPLSQTRLRVSGAGNALPRASQVGSSTGFDRKENKDD